MEFERLPKSFFEQETNFVAQNLLGKIVVFNGHKGYITETECYAGFDDEASHAFIGKTKRNTIMFGPAAHVYVYLIYGMYHCLNFVTESEDFPAAVLIRGLILFEPNKLVLDGPGKICKYLNITKEQNGVDISSSNSFYVTESNFKPNFISTPRIGISKGLDKHWRYVAELNKNELN